MGQPISMGVTAKDEAALTEAGLPWSDLKPKSDVEDVLKFCIRTSG